MSAFLAALTGSLFLASMFAVVVGCIAWLLLNTAHLGGVWLVSTESLVGLASIVLFALLFRAALKIERRLAASSQG